MYPISWLDPDWFRIGIRSGIRSTVIDIPYDAYANVDEKGYLINEEYAYIYDEVNNNKETLKSSKAWLVDIS